MTHNNDMENKTNATHQKQKRSNPMKKIGKSIKDTFIEMSSSLAGWIDDTGTQFSSKKTKSSHKNSKMTFDKNTSNSTEK